MRAHPPAQIFMPHSQMAPSPPSKAHALPPLSPPWTPHWVATLLVNSFKSVSLTYSLYQVTLTSLSSTTSSPSLVSTTLAAVMNSTQATPPTATRGPVASALALLLSPLVGSVCSTRSLVLTVKTSLSFALLVGPSPMTMEPTGFCLTLVKSFGVFILSLAIR